MERNRKVILYIAMSLDGYIAKPNDDLSFLSIVQKEGEDYGFNDFMESVDVVILGRKTYDWVMTQVPVFPHSDKETYVITRNIRSDENAVQFYTGDLPELIHRLKGEKGKDIFLDGGAEIVTEFHKLGLIDEFIISVIPILLGDGIRLFGKVDFEQQLKLVDVKTFDTGLTQMHYQIIN